MRHSESIAALIYLKSKVHKWKNIAFLIAIFSLLLVSNILFSGNSESIIESDYIANIKVEGVIFEDDFRSKILEKIAKNNSIKAVIVNINSPGGGIVGSEILYNEIREIAKKKPTVVLLGSVAASGGYMTAVAADYIVAYNGSLTGSIGVLMEAPQIAELAEKIGVKVNTYKSSPLKGSPSLFEKTNPLVDKVMQESIADSYEFFVNLVKSRRGDKIKKSNERIVFDGRVFTGRQALKLGLVDKIGGKKEALSYLSEQKIDVEKLSVREVEIIEKEKMFFDKFRSMIPFFGGVKNSKSSEQIMAIMS